MALSKATIRPYGPKDLSTLLVEKTAANGAGFTPGTLVVEVSGRIVECDTDVAEHGELPAYMVWTDGATRQDIRTYELDGTEIDNYTCISGQFKADLATSLFTATPEAGDVIVKSATAGKVDPLDDTELATLLGDPEKVVEIVGRVEGASRFGVSGFWNCSLDLG